MLNVSLPKIHVPTGLSSRLEQSMLGVEASLHVRVLARGWSVKTGGDQVVAYLAAR